MDKNSKQNKNNFASLWTACFALAVKKAMPFKKLGFHCVAFGPFCGQVLSNFPTKFEQFCQIMYLLNRFLALGITILLLGSHSGLLGSARDYLFPNIYFITKYLVYYLGFYKIIRPPREEHHILYDVPQAPSCENHNVC